MFGIRRRDDLPPAASCAGCGGAITSTELVWRRDIDGALRAGYLPSTAGADAGVWHLDCLEPACRPACGHRRSARPVVSRRACGDHHVPAPPVAAAPCYRAPAGDRPGPRRSPTCAARRPQPR